MSSVSRRSRADADSTCVSGRVSTDTERVNHENTKTAKFTKDQIGLVIFEIFVASWL